MVPAVAQMTISEPQIREYILGALDSPVAGEIDRRLFIDPQFAEEVFAIEEELLRDYDRDTLPAEVKRQFETRLSVDSVLRTKLEHVRSLSAALEEPVHLRAAAPPPKPADRALWAWLRTPRFAWGLTLVLAGTCAWLAVRNTRLADQVLAIQADDARRAAAAAALPATEPAARLPQFELSPVLTMAKSHARLLLIPTTAHDVQVLLAQRTKTDPGARFLAILQNPDAEELWSGPAAAAGGRVVATLPAERLSAGDYLLVLQMSLPAGTYREIETYTFAVVRR